MLNSITSGKPKITLTPAEVDLLAAFRAAADEAQPTMVRMMQSIAKGSPRQRLSLTLVGGQRQHQRTAGFGDPFVLLGMAVIGALLWMTAHDSSAPAPAASAPAPGAGIAYVPYVFADQDTGCQYLSTHTSTGLAPRIASDGKTHMGCKGGAQ